MTDLVTFGESMLRLSPPDKGRLETTTSLDVHVAGAESNLATAAARMGTDVVWTSKLPDSALGRRVVSALRGLGLETEVVWADEGRLGTYYIEFGGAPRGTDVLYDRQDAAVTTATPDELPLDRIASAEIFATSGITPALSETLAETTAALLDHAQHEDTRTVFDLNYRANLWDPEVAKMTVSDLLPAVDVLVIGEQEVETVLGHTGSPETIARELREQWQLDQVIFTRGSWGAVAVDGDDYLEQRAFEAETRDPIGTGDAFLGVLLARLIDGASLSEAMEWGAAAAALKRTIPGDMAVISRAEVERVIRDPDAGLRR